MTNDETKIRLALALMMIILVRTSWPDVSREPYPTLAALGLAVALLGTWNGMQEVNR